MIAHAVVMRPLTPHSRKAEEESTLISDNNIVYDIINNPTILHVCINIIIYGYESHRIVTLLRGARLHSLLRHINRQESIGMLGVTGRNLAVSQKGVRSASGGVASGVAR